MATARKPAEVTSLLRFGTGDLQSDSNRPTVHALTVCLEIDATMQATGGSYRARNVVWDVALPVYGGRHD